MSGQSPNPCDGVGYGDGYGDSKPTFFFKRAKHNYVYVRLKLVCSFYEDASLTTSVFFSKEKLHETETGSFFSKSSIFTP